MLYHGPGINPSHLLEYVIVPTLQALPIPYSPQAAALLLGTAWIESRCGQNLHQEPGPAMSLFQIEPKTFGAVLDLLWEPRHQKLLAATEAWQFPGLSRKSQLHGNLYYATAIARCLYFFSPLRIPTNIDDMYEMYRAVWKPGKIQPLQVWQEGIRAAGDIAKIEQV